jgi:hypothetical protein
VGKEEKAGTRIKGFLGSVFMLTCSVDLVVELALIYLCKTFKSYFI